MVRNHFRSPFFMDTEVLKSIRNNTAAIIFNAFPPDFHEFILWALKGIKDFQYHATEKENFSLRSEIVWPFRRTTALSAANKKSMHFMGQQFPKRKDRARAVIHHRNLNHLINFKEC